MHYKTKEQTENLEDINYLILSIFSELIKNKTLQFFSKALPILKADETLPKVAKYKFYGDEENA